MADKKEKSKRTVNPNLRPWKKGQSGNPKGRPTREMQCRELLAQIGEHGDEALAIIAEVMRNPRAGDAEEIRLKAANSILDRIVGKPTQSVAASILQRNIPADGTLIEGSTMISPLLAAAQAHFVEREMKQIEAPQAAPEPDPEPDPSPPLPDVIVLPDQSVASSKPTPQEPVAPLPSVQKAEAFKPAQMDSVAEVQTPPPPPPRPPYSGIPFAGAGYMALRDRERREQAERDQERARLQEEARRQGRPGGQLTREEAFPADPREGPEIVRFTRIPGGMGIRRC